MFVHQQLQYFCVEYQNFWLCNVCVSDQFVENFPTNRRPIIKYYIFCLNLQGGSDFSVLLSKGDSHFVNLFFVFIS